MRAFIVLCLVAAACADVSSLSGYNYETGASSNHGVVSGGDGGSAGIGGGHGGSGGSGGLGGLGGDAGYEKEFFSFTANDGDFDQPDASSQIANSLKKNLRVVFIKGPENKGLEDAALALAKHSGDQKTAIYILNKQTDLGDLANRLNAEKNNNNNKPEVHFVKYRTPEDAANAQQQIQSQYDSLPGSSQSHNGGVAPVLNFASKGSSGSGSEHGGYSHPHPSNTYVPPAATNVPSPVAPSNSYIPPATPGSSYIPPSIFRRFRL